MNLSICLRFTCIGFLKFYVTIHKLPKEKFLLLCLTSDLVRGDITAFNVNLILQDFVFIFSTTLIVFFLYALLFQILFAPIQKLSKKKFLLLCLTSNLVRGDITASLKKTIWYLVLNIVNLVFVRRLPSKNFGTAKSPSMA